MDSLVRSAWLRPTLDWTLVCCSKTVRRDSPRRLCPRPADRGREEGGDRQEAARLETAGGGDETTGRASEPGGGQARCSKRSVTRPPAVDWNGVFLGLFGDRRQRLNVGNRHRSPARLDQSAGLPSR